MREEKAAYDVTDDKKLKIGKWGVREVRTDN